MLIAGVALVLRRRGLVANRLLVPRRRVLAVVLFFVLVRAVDVLMPVLPTTEARRVVLGGVLLLCLRFGKMPEWALAFAMIAAVRSEPAVDVLVSALVAVLAVTIPVVLAERSVLALGHLGPVAFAPFGDLVLVLVGLRVNARLLGPIALRFVSTCAVRAWTGRSAFAVARLLEDLRLLRQASLG